MNTNSERKQIVKQIIRSGLWGTAPGLFLSLIISFLVGLFVFSSGSSVDLLERVYAVFLMTVLYGLGITGVPSGIIGLITGLIAGLIMSQSKKELSDNDAGSIGVAVSATIAVILLILVVIWDTTFDSVIFLLIPVLIYILASYFMGSFVYRRVFAEDSENGFENQ